MRDCTKIVFLLDRSGSMNTVKGPMEEVMNGYIANQKTVPGECTFTLIKFDDNYEIPAGFNNVPIKDVGQITLEPRGSTALLDAIGRAIDDVGKELAAMPENQRPNKLLFIVLTDGQENASTTYIPTNARMPKASIVFDKVKHQREVYKWEFMFLGADQDAIAASAGLGFDRDTTLNYTNTQGGVKGLGTKMSRMSSSYRGQSMKGASGQSGSVGMRNIAISSNNAVTQEDIDDWDKEINKTPEDAEDLVTSK